MLFHETGLSDAFIVEPKKLEDERGFFARVWCETEFKEQGLISELKQASISFNNKSGTLRGMHYQIFPSRESKLVRVTRGEVYDAIIDLRPESDTFLKSFSIVLNDVNRLALYIPPGFAHGFQTTTDNSEVYYQMSDFYAPDLYRGIRWNDPYFKLAWPEGARVINERDNSYPDFELSMTEQLRGLKA